MDQDFNSPAYAHQSAPDVRIIEPGQTGRDAFGHRFGSQVLVLTPEQMEALERGKQLAISIMEDEYALFITGPVEADHDLG